jgi:hypothetical protein
MSPHVYMPFQHQRQRFFAAVYDATLPVSASQVLRLRNDSWFYRKRKSKRKVNTA